MNVQQTVTHAAAYALKPAPERNPEHAPEHTMTHTAVLVMESRGLAPAVRSMDFSGTWSKLYRAGDVYLDMTLKPAAKAASLQGQLLTEGERALRGEIKLIKDGTVLASTMLGADADFGMNVAQPGLYGLELELSGETVAISDIKVR